MDLKICQQQNLSFQFCRLDTFLGVYNTMKAVKTTPSPWKSYLGQILERPHYKMYNIFRTKKDRKKQ